MSKINPEILIKKFIDCSSYLDKYALMDYLCRVFDLKNMSTKDAHKYNMLISRAVNEKFLN